MPTHGNLPMPKPFSFLPTVTTKGNSQLPKDSQIMHMGSQPFRSITDTNFHFCWTLVLTGWKRQFFHKAVACIVCDYFVDGYYNQHTPIRSKKKKGGF